MHATGGARVTAVITCIVLESIRALCMGTPSDQSLGTSGRPSTTAGESPPVPEVTPHQTHSLGREGSAELTRFQSEPPAE